MELQKTKLDEKTNLIKHYEAATIKNILQIGKLLKEINENKEYLPKYENFVDYVHANFKFKKSYAYSFISLYEKYGLEDFQRLEKIQELGGMRFVLVSIKEEDDHIDQIIERVEDKTIKTSEELSKQVKKLKNQVGEKPHYSQEQSEYEYKLVREGQNILEIRNNLVESVGKWMESTKSLSNEDIISLRVQIQEVLDKLK